MNSRIRLLIAAFEYMLDGDDENTVYAFRSLADDIEQEGSPDYEDLLDFIHNLEDVLSAHE